MLTQPENRLYAALHNREHPQIFFDMHQMNRDGARFMVPPFFDPLDPNLSGWILGEQSLNGQGGLAVVAFGEGRIVLIGFRPQFRAQARGTYKVLFNAILRAASRPSRLDLG